LSLEIDGFPSVPVSLKFHPDANFGSRVIETGGKFLVSRSDADQLQVGSKFRLIEVYNCEVYSIQDHVIKARKISEEIREKVMKIQWVVPDESTPFRVTVTGPLLLDEVYNPESLKISQGRAESSASDLKVGEMFQLVRFGFCRLDSPQSAILTHK
jgi:glutamyl-tRNA synthetase